MGSEHSRHNRRHTVTANPSAPYIRQSNNQQSQLNMMNANNKPNNILVPTHIQQAYSTDYVPPNKLLRSNSTPSTFSDHQKLTKPTRDLTASTPTQHLITSFPSTSNKPNSPKIKKNKLSKKNNIFPFKSKTKTHTRFQSAIPYIHFNDDSMNNNKSKLFNGHYHNTKNGKSKLKRNSARSANTNRNNNNNRKKKPSFLRNAFSSNDEEHTSSNDIDIDDASYHSDPSNTINSHSKSNKKKRLKRYNTHYSSNHIAKYNPRINNKTNHHKKHELYSRNHLRREMDLDCDDNDDKNKRKILLLGNGSCGKSTIFKQLKLILGHKSCFDDNELSEATHAIRQNCVSVLLIVLHKCTVLYDRNNKYFIDCNIDDTNERVRDCINYVMKYRSESFEKVEEDLTDLSAAISYLWNLKCVQTAIKFRHKRFTIPDNINYFYQQIETIFSSDYVPTVDDIIRLRIRTTGMIESKYNMLSDNNCDEYQLSLFDTGGERNERKKWIHTFENVDVVIFVAALSHFSCVLWEDEKTISMHDAIELFAEICNGRWFRRSEMILFLNKNDIFRQMLYDEISLKVGFADIKNEDYSIKIQHPEITPPPSPNAMNFDFPDFVEKNDGNQQKKTMNHNIGNKQNSDSFDIIDKNDVNDDDENEDKKNEDEYIPFNNLNPWSGKKWTGPNFKYDPHKTVEENNIYFEKCYDKAIEFIVSLFLKQNKDQNKTVYVHITNAIDEKNINDTFDEIKPLIINSNYAGHSRQFFMH